jgi:hypothetical protein
MQQADSLSAPLSLTLIQLQNFARLSPYMFSLKVVLVNSLKAQPDM